MWKNGKEGNTEGRRIMEGKDGRRETIEAEEKNGAKERGMRQAREGERQDRKEKKSGERQERRWENRMGGNKIIAAWLRRCGIK